MKPQNIMLNEISQNQKDKSDTLSLIWVGLQSGSHKKRERESKIVIAEGYGV